MLPSSRITISRLELFMGFVSIGLMGFGGVATAARYVIVEKRKWLSELDYANILGIGQVLPGGNIINMTIILGDRAHGIIGTCIALLGLMFMRPQWERLRRLPVLWSVWQLKWGVI